MCCGKTRHLPSIFKFLYSYDVIFSKTTKLSCTARLCLYVEKDVYKSVKVCEVSP